jgi:serine/threonine protein kinase
VVGIGEVLGNKYRVERLVGKGGMGHVVAARHEQLDQPVAIKILRRELCENQEAVARFLREARAAVRIQSEHVARVLDVDTTEDGVPYMVMELLEGQDLAVELQDGALTIFEAVDYILQACEALAEAHALGIVHRDLKPANLFRTEDRDGSALIKVVDFGISKALATDAPTSSGMPSTDTQGLLGSPHYMSPEQVRSPKTVDARSDIWSLGVVLYELLIGSPPFVSDTPMSVMAAVVTDAPPSIRGIRDDVPFGLEEAILKCLEKQPSQRYANVIELAEALQFYTPTGAAAATRMPCIARSARERAAGGRQRSPPDSVPDPVSSAPTLESPRLSRNFVEPWRFSVSWRHGSAIWVRRALAMLAGTMLAAGAILLGLQLTRSRPAPQYGSKIRDDVARTPAAASNDSPPASPAAPGGTSSTTGQQTETSAASPRNGPPQRVLARPKKEVPPAKARAEEPLAAPTSPTPGLPAVDNALDPLDGRE